MTKAEDERAAELYRGGMRIRDIAKKLCVRRGALEHALNREGVRRRPRRQQMVHGPERTCPTCGRRHTVTGSYCNECAREYRKLWMSGEKIRRHAEGQPPPPPPGFDPADRIRRPDLPSAREDIRPLFNYTGGGGWS